MNRQASRGTKPRRDEGSVLILVLVLMVIGSLIVVPVLSYATAVMRHNTVLSTKLKNQEAAKAGLRVALADPAALYNWCNARPVLPSPQIAGISVTSTCSFLSETSAADDSELHLGLVATRVGEVIPNGLQAIVELDPIGNPVLDGEGNPVRFVYQPSTPDPAEWLDTSATWAPHSDSEPSRIWAPHLPVHGLNLRSSTGYQMPAGYPACRVFFPGTYNDPVVLDGPTYFTSGVYYFRSPVTVQAGADVVVGLGQHLGCVTDQEAAFYAVNAPATHNISGLGATFVFGSDDGADRDGKLVIDNTAGALRIVFNQRYVNAQDQGGQPSFGVSIASVNGDLVSGPNAAGEFDITDLVVPGVNQVPASKVPVVVDSPDPETPVAYQSAGLQNYEPSRLTHEPQPPTPPRWPTSNAVQAFRTGSGTTDGAIRVAWEPPENLGGSPIGDNVDLEGYVATAQPGGATCTPTVHERECVLTGLTHNTQYTVTVTARNGIGRSSPSAVSAQVRPRTTAVSGGGGGPESPLISAPATPTTRPTVVRHPDNTVVVTWSPPNANNAPISSYALTATPAIDFDATPCVLLSATSCMIRNLPVADPSSGPLDPSNDYTFRFTATNEMGTSAASPASVLSVLVLPLLGSEIPANPNPSPADPAPEVPDVVPPYEPPPIVDINLASSNNVVVDIPGYIAVPQGVFRLRNPHGLGSTAAGGTVAISGGILAAAFRVQDARLVPGELTVPIGLVNPIVQRTFRITSTTTGTSPRAVSTAVVQVNQNGGFAINSWVVQ